MMRGVLIVAVLLVACVALAGWETDGVGVEWVAVPGNCPLHDVPGIPVPEHDQLADCQCEKWWRGQAPARLVFADCSHRTCAEFGPTEATPFVYVDLQLYRCPQCGLLFTEPE